MKSQTCSQCGTAFVLPDAPKPVDLLVSNRTFIPLEAYTKATCPHCGSREWATARIFFGMVGPRGLERLIVTGIVLFLAAVICSMMI